ncbi:identical protein binding [Homalodisca vitripennis]|nr:identical protein binding [Homalodisca vitripennis]
MLGARSMLNTVAKEVFINNLHSVAGGGERPLSNDHLLPHIDELISVAQYQDRLEKCYEEITRLKEENYRLQGEVNEVKTRSKKLCHILLQAEMKDKATILVEVHELQRVKNELSDEVSSLVAQLEQEKSKVRALTGGDAKAKDKLLVNYFA